MKKSFFEKLTGSHHADDKEREIEKMESNNDWMEENNEEGQLTVDVYQTTNDIFVKAIVAGLKPDDLDITITRDMVTIRGSREESHRIEEDDYFCQELYWGAFSRSVLLPQEVNPDEAEATTKNGLITIKLPKLDKKRIQKLKVKGD